MVCLGLDRFIDRTGAPLALSNALGARMCRGTIFFDAILHNYNHEKEKMIEERKFNLNLKNLFF